MRMISKVIVTFLIFLFVQFLSLPCVFAETIKLKNGITMNGEIVELTEEHVLIDKGKNKIYRLKFDQIEDADVTRLEALPKIARPKPQPIVEKKEVQQVPVAQEPESQEIQSNQKINQEIESERPDLKINSEAARNGVIEDHLTLDGLAWKLNFMDKRQDVIRLEFLPEKQDVDNWSKVFIYTKMSAAPSGSIRESAEAWFKNTGGDPATFKVLSEDNENITFQWSNEAFGEIDRMTRTGNATHFMMFISKPSIDSAESDRWVNLINNFDLNSPDLLAILNKDQAVFGRTALQAIDGSQEKVVNVKSVGEFAKIQVEPTKTFIDTLNSTNEEAKNKLIREVVSNSDKYNPIAFYALAYTLFQQGEKDEAVFWYYAGQIRGVYDASRCADVSARSAVPEMESTYAPIIVPYAVQNLEILKKTIAQVVDWDDKTPYSYDHRWINLHGMQAMKSGLSAMSNENASSEQAPMSIPEDQWPAIKEALHKEYLSDEFINAAKEAKNNLIKGGNKQSFMGNNTVEEHRNSNEDPEKSYQERKLWRNLLYIFSVFIIGLIGFIKNLMKKEEDPVPSLNNSKESGIIEQKNSVNFPSAKRLIYVLFILGTILNSLFIIGLFLGPVKESGFIAVFSRPEIWSIFFGIYVVVMIIGILIFGLKELTKWIK